MLHQYTRLLRQRRLLIFSFGIILMFLLYQLLSVGQLGKELSERKIRTNFRMYEKADGFIKHGAEDKSKETMWHGQEDWNENVKYVLGVLSENQKYYFPSPKHTFQCIHSGEEISFSCVNDNFCDCSDFSDEPSTSACNFGRFYCTHQKSSPASIISYKVNDGICDCCDGSDEWENIPIPEHTQLPASKQKGIFQLPCQQRCIS